LQEEDGENSKEKILGFRLLLRALQLTRLDAYTLFPCSRSCLRGQRGRVSPSESVMKYLPAIWHLLQEQQGVRNREQELVRKQRPWPPQAPQASQSPGRHQ